MHSDDEIKIDAKFDELTKNSLKSRKAKDDKTVVSPKNTLTRKRRTSTQEQKSSDASVNKKPKIPPSKKLRKSTQDPEQTSQVYIQEHLKKSPHHKSTVTNKRIIKSPTKQELKKKLEEMQAQLDAVAGKTQHNKKQSKLRGSSPITESPDDSSELEDILSDTDLKSPCSSNESLNSPTTKKFCVKKDKTKIQMGNESQNKAGTKPKEETENDKDDIELKRKNETVEEDDDKMEHSGDELNKKKKSQDIIDPMNEKKYTEDEKKNTDPDFYDEDDQLFGPDHSMKMINIGDGIHCIEFCWNLAQSSKEGTIMIRHLMEGIFRHDKILNCTFTGQRPRNRPKDSNEKFYPLHTKATQCIINLVLKRAEGNAWKKKPNMVLFHIHGKYYNKL